MTDIRQAGQEDIPLLYDIYHHVGKKDDGYFEHAFEQGSSLYISFEKDKATGFCLLNWTPRYSLYRKLEIPEIQDLNVLPKYRRRGIATALIKWCEGVARSKNKEIMGISVGLTKDYGPAQVLYARLGYLPDGNGVTYDRDGVRVGKSYPMDDNLALMLIKPL